LFMSNKAAISLPAGKLTLTQTTNYPWEGRVEMGVDPAHSERFVLHVRIPGWAKEQPIPGDLYHYASGGPADLTKTANMASQVAVPITVNGEKVEYKVEKGYAILDRTWKKGDKVVVEFPMEIRKVLANDRVKADR